MILGFSRSQFFGAIAVSAIGAAAVTLPFRDTPAPAPPVATVSTATNMTILAEKSRAVKPRHPSSDAYLFSTEAPYASAFEIIPPPQAEPPAEPPPSNVPAPTQRNLVDNGLMQPLKMTPHLYAQLFPEPAFSPAHFRVNTEQSTALNVQFARLHAALLSDKRHPDPRHLFQNAVDVPGAHFLTPESELLKHYNGNLYILIDDDRHAVIATEDGLPIAYTVIGKVDNGVDYRNQKGSECMKAVGIMAEGNWVETNDGQVFYSDGFARELEGNKDGAATALYRWGFPVVPKQDVKACAHKRSAIEGHAAGANEVGSKGCFLFLFKGLSEFFRKHGIRKVYVQYVPTMRPSNPIRNLLSFQDTRP